jgi:hypothetical protein
MREGMDKNLYDCPTEECERMVQVVTPDLANAAYFDTRSRTFLYFKDPKVFERFSKMNDQFCGGGGCHIAIKGTLGAVRGRHAGLFLIWHETAIPYIAVDDLRMYKDDNSRLPALIGLAKAMLQLTIKAHQILDPFLP